MRLVHKHLLNRTHASVVRLLGSILLGFSDISNTRIVWKLVGSSSLEVVHIDNVKPANSTSGGFRGGKGGANAPPFGG